ncbi:hypothetical protein NAPIS_ORF00489 [Vairimorpha apis BRL 01]|uniref:Uncharacterized protein n=1 Tax=Vairimorpha apis BRL 01 TaxID=1037528 RepID=T0MLR3_9MICR|nr:hypothetical protein NAPIS_ORF00489 [Vairimorpha apis BRL 01]
MASSKILNKRANDKDEPINLSAKFRRLENTYSFQDININDTSKDKRFFEYNIYDIEINLKNIDTTESFIYIVKIIANYIPYNEKQINFLIKETNKITSKNIKVKINNTNY